MKPRIAPGVMAFLSLVVFSASPAAAQGADAATADPFLLQAAAELAGGSAVAARTLADSALELVPGDSEGLYIRAQAGQDDRNLTRSNIADLRAALQAGTWRRTDPSAARLALAGLLIRTGSYTEAQALLEPLARTVVEDYHPVLLLARVQFAGGAAAAGDRTLADAAARFPLVDELRLLSADRLDSLGRSAAALEVISTGLSIHPDSLALLLASARLETPARKVAAVEAYLARGGTDPLAPLIGMEASVKDRAKYLGQFLDTGGLSREDLVERAAAAVKTDKAQTLRLQDALDSYTGNRDLDRNGDGFWEERWVFQKGLLTSWSREPAQDGVDSFSATFSAGAPATVTWRTAASATVSARYSQYPFLESVSPTPGATLVLVPRSARFAFLPGVPAAPGMAPRVPARLVPPALSALRGYAYRLDEYDTSSGTLVRSTLLSRGTPVYSEEDTAGDGVMDHRLWYTAGVPTRGERVLPGGLLLRETWTNGRLTSAEADTDGDGKADYRETYQPSLVSSWDFNEDGIPDSRMFVRPDGSVVRELSSRLNGVFDVRVVYSNGRIVAVTRGNTSLQVTSDPARGVTWIGTPAPAGARPDSGAPDGLQEIGGAGYLVFHQAGVLYAEASP